MELKIDPDSFSFDGSELTIKIDSDDLIEAVLEKITIETIIEKSELTPYEFLEKVYEKVYPTDQDEFIEHVSDFLNDYQEDAP